MRRMPCSPRAYGWPSTASAALVVTFVACFIPQVATEESATSAVARRLPSHIQGPGCPVPQDVVFLVDDVRSQKDLLSKEIFEVFLQRLPLLLGLRLVEIGLIRFGIGSRGEFTVISPLESNRTDLLQRARGWLKQSEITYYTPTGKRGFHVSHMAEPLRKASSILHGSVAASNSKTVFIIMDGLPEDGRSTKDVAAELHREGVRVVVLWVSHQETYENTTREFLQEIATPGKDGQPSLVFEVSSYTDLWAIVQTMEKALALPCPDSPCYAGLEKSVLIDDLTIDSKVEVTAKISDILQHGETTRLLCGDMRSGFSGSMQLRCNNGALSLVNHSCTSACRAGQAVNVTHHGGASGIFKLDSDLQSGSRRTVSCGDVLRGGSAWQGSVHLDCGYGLVTASHDCAKRCLAGQWNFSGNLTGTQFASVREGIHLQRNLDHSHWRKINCSSLINETVGDFIVFCKDGELLPVTQCVSKGVPARAEVVEIENEQTWWLFALLVSAGVVVGGCFYWLICQVCCKQVPGKSAVVVPEDEEQEQEQKDQKEESSPPIHVLRPKTPLLSEYLSIAVQTDALPEQKSTLPQPPQSAPLPPPETQSTETQSDPFVFVEIDRAVQKPLDLVICADMGGSIDTQAMERALEMLEQLVQELDMPPVQVGVLGIAGQRFQKLPLTGSKREVLEYINSMNPASSPTAPRSHMVTRMAPALGIVSEILGQSHRYAGKALVVVTGTDPIDILEVSQKAQLLKSQGVRIVFIQVGPDSLGTAEHSILVSAQYDQLVCAVPTFDYVSIAVQQILEESVEVSTCAKRAKFCMSLAPYTVVDSTQFHDVRGWDVMVPGWEPHGPDNWTWRPQWDSVLEDVNTLRWNASMLKAAVPASLDDVPKQCSDQAFSLESFHDSKSNWQDELDGLPKDQLQQRCMPWTDVAYLGDHVPMECAGPLAKAPPEQGSSFHSAPTGAMSNSYSLGFPIEFQDSPTGNKMGIMAPREHSLSEIQDCRTSSDIKGRQSSLAKSQHPHQLEHHWSRPHGLVELEPNRFGSKSHSAPPLSLQDMTGGARSRIGSELQARPLAHRVSIDPTPAQTAEKGCGSSAPIQERRSVAAKGHVLEQYKFCNFAVQTDPLICVELGCGRHAPLDLCICVAQSGADAVAFDRAKHFVERIARCTHAPEVRLALLRPAPCGPGVEEVCPLRSHRADFLRALATMSDFDHAESRTAPLLRMALTLLESQDAESSSAGNKKAVLLIVNRDPSDLAATEAAARALIGAGVRLVFVATEGHGTSLAVKRLAALSRAADEGPTLFKACGDDLHGLVPEILKRLVMVMQHIKRARCAVPFESYTEVADIDLVDGQELDLKSLSVSCTQMVPWDAGQTELNMDGKSSDDDQVKEDAKRELAQIRAIAEAEIQRLRQEVEDLQNERAQATQEPKISQLEQIREAKIQTQAEVDQIRGIAEAEIEKLAQGEAEVERLKISLEKDRCQNAKEVEDANQACLKTEARLQTAQAEVGRLSEELEVTGAYSLLVQDKLNESLAEAQSLREEMDGPKMLALHLRSELQEARLDSQQLRTELQEAQKQVQRFQSEVADAGTLHQHLRGRLAQTGVEALHFRDRLEESSYLKDSLTAAQESMAAAEAEARQLRGVLEDAQKLRKGLNVAEKALDSEETARIVAEENLRRLQDVLDSLPDSTNYRNVAAQQTLVRQLSPDARRSLGLPARLMPSRTRTPGLPGAGGAARTRSPSVERIGRHITSPTQYGMYSEGQHVPTVELTMEGPLHPEEQYHPAICDDSLLSLPAMTTLLEAHFRDLRAAYLKFDDMGTRQLTLPKLIKGMAGLNVDKHTAKVLYYRLQQHNRGYLTMEDWLRGLQASRLPSL